MKSDEDILMEASQRFTDYMAMSDWWYENECKKGYALYEGNQWSAEAKKRYEEEGLEIQTINKVAPLIDAVSGFEIQNRTEVDFQARLPDEQQDGFRDIVGSVVKYIEEDSQQAEKVSHAFKDMLISGIGCTLTSQRYDENPDGEIEIERIYPGLVMHDTAARQKNLRDANWVAVVKVTD